MSNTGDPFLLIPMVFGGIVSVIGSVSAAILSWQNNRNTRDLKIATSENGERARENGRKSDAIHVLVNSGMAKALADLTQAQEEIRTLRDLVNALNARVIGNAAIAAELAIVQARKDANTQPSTAVTSAQAATPKPSTP